MAADVNAAFGRWLGRGRPGHVPGEWPELAEATSWILAAGGKAAIAHPLRYTLSAGARRELCAEFRVAGGHGVEVVTGGPGPGQREKAISLAVRSGLEGSVGSDFHDPAVPWNPPGRLAKLPDSIRPIWSDFQPA
jgi:predicted metal-dependent phosphoesterase TrpH